MDKNYWESIYSKQSEGEMPSLFAKYVAENLKIEGKSLIELGCGNGRDAIFFANANSNVTAIDQCDNIIELLDHRFQKVSNLQFKCLDFTNLDNNSKYDIVYSRFTLHSISKEQERKVLQWAYLNLNPNGKFCIEVRGQKNEIFQVGVPVDGDPDAFILNDHYRRFIHFESFCKELESIGFLVDYAKEQKGFAPYNGTDETYIRIITSKPC
jgi:ubiquinone/menaquinone biosynthesis C-methylase UbiE